MRNIWFILFFFCVLIVSIPVFFEFFFRPYFVYENGWDEATYLSYQGALATYKSGLRWTSGSVILALHFVGLSGAQQNLIFDIVTFAVFLVVVIFVVRCLGITDTAQQGRLVLFGIFGAVLFNQSNPLLLDAFPSLRSTDTIWAVAFESYHPLLRTPEPQLSVILILITVACFFAYGRRWWILVIPAPFLYFPVFVPYVFCAGVYILHNWLGAVRPLSDYWRARLVFANVGMVLTLSAGMAALRLSGVVDHGVDLNLVRFWHGTRVSPSLLWSAGALGAAWLLVRNRLSDAPRRAWASASFTVFVLQVLIVAQPILSGVEIHPLGLQATAGTMGAAFSLCLLIEALWIAAAPRKLPVGATIISLAASVGIIVSLVAVEGARAVLVLVLPGLAAEDFQRVKEAPLDTIVPGYIGGRIVMAEPRMLAPPLSYQYAYTWFMAACPEAVDANRAAVEFVQNRQPPLLAPLLLPWLDDLDRASELTLQTLDKIQPAQGDSCTGHSRDQGTLSAVPVEDVPSNSLRSVLRYFFPTGQ